jgi:hypothetical protein
MKIIIALLFAGALAAQTRTVGPEPGLDFGTLPSGSSLSTYGTYLRMITTSSFPQSPKLIRFVDTWLTNHRQSDQSLTLFPWTQAQRFFVKVTFNGATYNAVYGYSNPLASSQDVRYGMNIADPAFLDYTFNNFVPNILIPTARSKGIAVDSLHPLYVSMDGYDDDYKFYGVVSGGKWTNAVTWNTGYPQSAAEWLAAYENFYSYAKAHAPLIRLIPHLSWMGKRWNTFQQIYANTPGVSEEWFPLSSLQSYSAYQKNQFYNEIMNVSWFGNKAAPVFAGDPPTRIVQWGTALDNGDIHTALALYAMVKGPNTFFPLLDGQAKYPVSPGAWLSTATKLGSALSSSPTVVVGAGSTSVLMRKFVGGIAYFNIGAGTYTFVLPTDKLYTDWSGNRVKSVTLANGKGNVFLVSSATVAVAGSSVKGVTSSITQ